MNDDLLEALMERNNICIAYHYDEEQFYVLIEDKYILYISEELESCYDYCAEILFNKE